MRVQFKYTLEDIVDGSSRFQARSRSVRSIRLKWNIFGSLFVWAILIVYSRFTIKGVILGLVAALVAMAIEPPLYQYLSRKNMRKLFREMYGDQNHFTCEVELSPEALKTNSEQGQNTTEWSKIEEVVPTSDSVDIFGPAAAVIVRNRAFTSAEERQRFIDLAREYINQARGRGSN
jgi:hypothetical protein